MVEWEEEAPVPGGRLGNASGKGQAVRLDRFECPQRGGAEGNHERGGDQPQLRSEMVRAIEYFGPRRWPVAATFVPRVAKDRVGDKDILASKAALGKETCEVSAGLVVAQRYASDLGAKASRGLGDKENPGVRLAVQVAEDAPAPGHRRAGSAIRHGGHQIREGNQSDSAVIGHKGILTPVPRATS